MFLRTTFGLHITIGNFNVVSIGIAIVIGCVVGLCAERSAWWLAPLCLLPMVIYGSLLEPSQADIVFSVLDAAVALIVALLVSRFRQQPALT
jgi:hypothetical protein